MKQLLKNLVLFAGVMGIMACSGAAGTNGTNNATDATARNITGTVADSGSSNLMKLETASTESATTECFADTVIATNSAAETTTAIVDEACLFSLSLAVGKSYVISFSLEGEFVATLIVDDETASSFKVSSDGTTMDLGEISIEDFLAYPEHSPLEYLDEDEDGLSDWDDLDDDNDGIEDEEEDYCYYSGGVEIEVEIEIEIEVESEGGNDFEFDYEEKIKVYYECEDSADEIDDYDEMDDEDDYDVGDAEDEDDDEDEEEEDDDDDDDDDDEDDDLD
ncbi:hypothetical protein KJ708_02785 [bacterium]|nr:hypothetical protein [bacterium]MBU1918353.1 hypothetical protein [bacterium]